ncbi:hypothetical protein Q8A67_025354 [Cirrhinus molitorella]|uniref:Uncharacterized protein n=1 Tax=Cirrhinus molitorella TaxID=172907 RepID=A0AA88T871_9TELE|nr:hypothetical protein Q8A67_025354 [Cirrhinus molitorella]
MKGAVHSDLEESIRPYIDLIDTLRSAGIHKDLSLPTIIVIGDQSSGKSSVLEALSGVPLPRGTGIVTRCPLELRLKKVEDGVSLKAVLSYNDNRIEFVDSSLLENHVNEAQNELAGRGVGICDNLITLEVMSPDVCDLTLIDLPGIARVPVNGQPQDIGNQIKRMILKYIEKQETIIMVVCPCNTDLATTEALKMAQEVDPEGKRTIAILTKPDLIDRGTEKRILRIVNNKVIPLHKGYIMVKCRGQQQINDKISLEEATQMERDFFRNHEFFRCLLEEEKATIKSLSVKLSLHLVNHIKKSLPQLNEQIKKKLWDLRNELKECKAGPPEDPKGAKQFLIETLKRFNDDINSLSLGELMTEDNLFAQLRDKFTEWNDHLNLTKKNYNDLATEMIQSIKKYRGRELLGFSNYRMFEMVLQKHVAKLKAPAIGLLNTVKDIITEQFTHVVKRCFQNYPTLQNITLNKIDNIQSNQQAKAEERISEQLEMEIMIFTQDAIYLKSLNKISEETFSEDELPIFDKKSKYSELLQAYYEIVVRRMSDQLPMMISFFMLKKTAQLLSTEILSLLDGANVSELLFENSDVSRRRRDLQARLDRMSQRIDDEYSDSSQSESQEMKGAVHSHLEESIRPYIDLIDTLRSVGIHKDLGLPTIVVIGDQSSGKSSVLEALSGVALPRGSGIVTRCPLELRLKKVPDVKWKGVLSYRDKRIEFLEYALVQRHVETAQNELAGKGVGICDELITLEIMSSDVCDLTLIDLPGIARVPVKGQPEDIGDQIKSLIMKFIEKQETINLVVVPCNTDIATTEALKMAQEVDPEGKRTLTILTKPDIIDSGTENDILDIAYNKVIPLSKGYIMVKCRGQRQINDEISLENAAEMERDFFQNHDYFRRLLNENKATMKCLAVKLTENLVDHIKKSLPQLDEEIKRQLWDVRNELKEFEGGPPQDPKGAKQFLIKILTTFNAKIMFLSSGELVNTENLFVQLREEFRKWNDHLNNAKPSFYGLKEFAQNYRGRELLGFSNYRGFESALQGHVAKLKYPAIDLLRNIRDIILRQFRDVSYKCFHNYPVLQNITENKINNIQSSQEAKAEQRISEQFEMENMIYTQDPIYLKVLNEISDETFSEDHLPIFDIKSKYSEMLQAYYEIVVQRMADQLPMMISFFMLKETAQLLSFDMLSLLDGANVSELLFEDSEVGTRRRDLHARLDRLTAAYEALSGFI